MHRAVRRHGPAGRDERLPGDLPAIDPLDGLVGRPAAEDIDLDLLQVEQVEQLVEGVAHELPRPPGTDGNTSARKRDRCLADSAPGVRAGAQDSASRTRARVTAT